MPTPLPIIPDVYRVAFLWQEADAHQHAVNVMHFHTTLDVAGLATAIGLAVDGSMWGASVPGAYITDLSIIKLDGTSGTVTEPTGGAPSTPPWAGGTAGDFVPAAAQLVKFQTGLRGRDNRGRVFLPFISEAAMSDGTVSGVLVAAQQTAWTEFYGDLVTDPPSPVQLGVAAYDRAHGGAGAHFHPVTSVTVEAVLGTQRKRQSRLR